MSSNSFIHRYCSHGCCKANRFCFRVKIFCTLLLWYFKVVWRVPIEESQDIFTLFFCFFTIIFQLSTQVSALRLLKTKYRTTIENASRRRSPKAVNPVIPHSRPWRNFFEVLLLLCLLPAPRIEHNINQAPNSERICSCLLTKWCQQPGWPEQKPTLSHIFTDLLYL
jgi:hypothetical protein